MNYWFYINLSTLLLAIVFFLWSLPKNGILLLAVLFGLLSLLFILFNCNMHAIFSKIRKLNNQNKRIKIAKYARKIMPYHMAIGLIGLVTILGHMLFVFIAFGAFVHIKMISGLIAFLGLLLVS